MYSWGRASDGQLGLGGIQDTIVTAPRWNKHVAEKSIRHLACGLKHTLLLTDGGIVHSCGSNEKGQLGQDETSTRPAPIISLETKKIAHVCCGSVHSIAVDCDGQLFSWGGNQYGQLGYGAGERNVEVNFVPKIVPVVSQRGVVQVCCGANHTLALVRDGRLYSWGENSDGQLGHSKSKDIVRTPRVISALKDMPIVKIASGKAHNIILSPAGGVFAWGRNNFGQLGFEVKADPSQPAEVRRLRHEKVKFVSCGEEHTAVLTQDGRIFTFGSNSYGQLGHNNTQNVSIPTRVCSLAGKEVCQVACGRMHTLVLVKDSCEVLSFGLGANGQLGRESTSNSLQPDPILGDYWTAPVISEAAAMGTLLDVSLAGGGGGGARVLKGIYAGGDQSFATTVLQTQETMDVSSGPVSPPELPLTPMMPATPTTPGSSPLRDDRIIHYSQRPYFLTAELMTNWLEDNIDSTDMDEVFDIFKVVFSSPACLNASFLKSVSERPTSEEKSGVDLLGFLKGYGFIHDKLMEPHINRCNDDPMERWLVSGAMDGLPSRPLSLECCNVYYLMPLCLTKPPRKLLMLTFMSAFLKLNTDFRNSLGNWFFNSSKDYIEMIITMVKRYLVNEIIDHAKVHVALFLMRRQRQMVDANAHPRLYSTEEEENMLTILEFFKLFFMWNLMRNEPINYKLFHFEDLDQVTNLPHDYLSAIDAVQHNDRVIYCHYPFALDETCKSRLLEVECRIQQNIAVFTQGAQFLDEFWTEERISFVLTVSRENLLNGTLSSLVSADDMELKKPLRVIFADEEGQDDGGIRKEFFMLLFSQILNPDFGMFVEDEESHLVWFRESELFYENVDYYLLIGILCGLAMYNQVLVDLPFPVLLYKKLLGRPTSIDELSELRPTLAQSFINMVRYEGDNFDDMYDLTFSVNHMSFGEVQTVDLIPDGSNVRVTKQSAHDYVQAYMRYTYHDSVKNQFEAFQRGFMKVCNGRVIHMLHPCELQALMVGNRVTDWNELEEHMLYANGYSRQDPTIQHFWDTFHNFPEDTKRKFLVFFTGSDRIPLAGIQSMRMTIQKMDGGSGCAKLPVAHTCFNVLDLPPYTTKDEMKQKLLQAIHFTSGFGLI